MYVPLLVHRHSNGIFGDVSVQGWKTFYNGNALLVAAEAAMLQAAAGTGAAKEI